MQANQHDVFRCQQCGYEGAPKSSSSNMFLIFIAMLLASAFFLPLVIVALAFMFYMITKPSKRSCPQCKSIDIQPVLSESSKG